MALTALRRVSTLAATFGQRRLLVTLEIPSKDRSYPWFLEWMAHENAPQSITSRSAAEGSSRSVEGWAAIDLRGKSPMRSMRSHELAVETTYKQHENGSSEAIFNLVPGPGTHYFKYRGSWFQVSNFFLSTALSHC